MPFDEQPTDYTVKPDVFSVTGLRDWLATQDGATIYCYHATGDCLLHRYFRNNGVPMSEDGGVGGDYIYTANGEIISLSWEMADIAVSEPHTYQGALDRCNALIKEGVA